MQNLREKWWEKWCYTSGCWDIWGYAMNNMPWFGNSSDGLLLDFSTRPDMRNSPIWEWWKSTKPRKQFVSATLNSNKASGQTWQLKNHARVIYIYGYSHLRPIWPIDSRWFPSHVWWQWRLFQPFGSTELHHPMAFVFYLGKWLAIEAPKQKRIEAHSKNI